MKKLLLFTASLLFFSGARLQQLHAQSEGLAAKVARLLVDCQSGLANWVQDFSPDDFKLNQTVEL
jgi:hypothetical protein